MSFHRPFTNVLTGTCVAFLKQLPDIIQGSVANLITLKMQLMYTRKQCFENSKVCVTDLEFQCKMIKFESILTAFQSSFDFRGRWSSRKKST